MRRIDFLKTYGGGTLNKDRRKVAQKKDKKYLNK